MTARLKTILKKIGGWIAFLALTVLLCAAPQIYLRYRAHSSLSRRAVCWSESVGARSADVERVVSKARYWNHQSVSLSGRIVFSSAQGTFYLRDGIFSLPLDVSDCQGLDAFQDGETPVRVQGTVAENGGAPLLVLTKLYETVPTFLQVAFAAGLFGIFILFVKFVAGVIGLLIWFLVLIGLVKRRPPPSAEEVNSKKAGATLVSGLFLPFLWFFNPIVGAGYHVSALVSGWRGLHSKKRPVAIAGIALCALGLVVMPLASIAYGWHEDLNRNIYDAMAEPTIEPTGQEPLDAHPYVNDKRHFSIHVPKGWTTVEDEKAEYPLVLRGPQDGTFRDKPFNAEINFNYGKMAEIGIKDAAETIEAFKELAAKNNQGFSLIADEKIALAGGRLAADLYEFTDTTFGFERHFLGLFTAYDGTIYLLHAGLPVETWDRYAKVIRDSLLTFAAWKGNFADCLKNRKAIFYGLFDCGPCQDQKKLFTDGTERLPYVECKSQEDGTLLSACADKDITGYPTWVFADGSRLVGFQDLKVISQTTGCPLPK